jgi:hypothetical protein
LGKWTRLQVSIDYNHLQLKVDGKVVEQVSLPLPFKGSPKTPLVLGNKGRHPVAKGIPDHALAGSIRYYRLTRGNP